MTGGLCCTTIMSPESLERGQYKTSFEEVVSNAKKNFLADGNHMPTFVIEGSNNLVIARLQGLPETHGEKKGILRFLGQQTAMSGKVDQLRQVFMISEAWVVSANKDELAKTRPLPDPNKKEVLMISGIQIKERKKYIKLFEILRDSNKQVIGLGEFKANEKKDKEVENPLLDAFISGFRTAFQIKYN